MSTGEGGNPPKRARAIAAPVPAVRPVPPLALDLSRLPRWLSHQLATEVDRRTPFLWLPVAFGVGICLAFSADREPSLGYAAFWGLAFALGAMVLRRHPGIRMVLVALSAVAFGIVAAAHRTERITTPVVDRILIGDLTGFVETVDVRGEGRRLLVRVTDLTPRLTGGRPVLVRITTRGPVAIRPGDHISARVRLLPPPEPARPGGYDFARDAFFKQIGAVGSVLGAVRSSPAAEPPPWNLRVAASIDDVRNRLTERIASAFGGQAGAVAAALVTGKRGLIDEETNDALRAAGIYHIVSISGLHMVLVAGAVFGLVRGLLALSPVLALTWPIKKLAAVAAMLAATAYCIFSGGEVATERSLVMTLAMMGAILVDRPALSLRNLAIAALIIMVLEPETVLGPSFQMSFAAVAALVAFAGVYTARAPFISDSTILPFRLVSGLASKTLQAGVALVATTVLAGVATAPFGLFHFHTANPFAVIGNAMALPLVSLIVMPCGLLGAALAPLGLDGWAWWSMAWGVAMVLETATWIEGWKGARTVVPAFGSPALVCLALALGMATLCASRLRYLAVVPVAIGVVWASNPVRPDIYIDREAAGAAIRGSEGRLVLVGRPSDFVAGQWLAADGDERLPDDESLLLARQCDQLGCVVRLADGRAVAFLRDRRAFREDCPRAAVLIMPFDAPSSCPGATVIDRATLQARGAVALTVTADRIAITGARDGQAQRLWADRGRSAAQQPAAISTPANAPANVPARRAAPDADQIERDAVDQ